MRATPKKLTQPCLFSPYRPTTPPQLLPSPRRSTPRRRRRRRGPLCRRGLPGPPTGLPLALPSGAARALRARGDAPSVASRAGSLRRLLQARGRGHRRRGVGQRRHRSCWCQQGSEERRREQQHQRRGDDGDSPQLALPVPALAAPQEAAPLHGMRAVWGCGPRGVLSKAPARLQARGAPLGKSGVGGGGAGGRRGRKGSGEGPGLFDLSPASAAAASPPLEARVLRDPPPGRRRRARGRRLRVRRRGV